MINPGSFQPPLFGERDLVATGNTQVGALPLLAGGNVFARVDPGTGAILPAPNQNQVLVFNEGDNDLLVYPNFGDRIGELAVNLSVSIPPGGSGVFNSFDTPLQPSPKKWLLGATNTAAGVNVVADNSTTVSAVTRLQFSSGVTNGGSGVAHIDVSTANTTIVAQAGPFLTAGTVVNSGTITNSVASLTANQLLLGNDANAVQTLGTLGTTTTVLHGNPDGKPTFEPVSLASDVTGNLPLANLSTMASGLLGNSGTVSAAPAAVPLGAGLVFSGGSLTATNTAAAGGVLSSNYPNPGFAAIAASSLLANSGTVSGAPAAIPIGSGLAFVSGTLTAPGPGPALIVTDGTTSVASTSTLTVSGGSVSSLGAGSAKITVTGGGGGVTSVVVNASPFLNSGTINSTGTITAATLAASSLIGNSAGTGAVPGAIAIGANLTLNSGTLSASAGNGFLLQGQATLSSANILALGTTAVTLVAAPGVGFMVKPIASTIVYRHVSAPYTGGGNTNLFYGSSAGSTSGSSFASAFTVGSNRALLQIVNTSGTFTTAQVDNQPLVLQSPTAFAGGDGTALLTVDYVVLPSS